MNIDILKESYIEKCENIYALSMNYLKNNQNLILRNLLDEIIKIEVNLRECTDLDKINLYTYKLDNYFDRIEVIVGE